jgi:hypothetical protein
MIEVKMGENEIGHLRRLHASPREILEQIPVRTFKSVPVDLAFGPETAHPAIDQDHPLIAPGQEAIEGETNAVAVVGRVLPLPEHLGHNPEHGTAIEQVAPVGDNLTLVASKEHDELSWSGGGSELAE